MGVQFLFLFVMNDWGGRGSRFEFQIRSAGVVYTSLTINNIQFLTSSSFPLISERQTSFIEFVAAATLPSICNLTIESL